MTDVELDSVAAVSTNTSTDTLSLLKQKHYPAELTFRWKLLHCASYVAGSLLFLTGSVQYYTSSTNYQAGGWCFTLGGVGFVVADFLSFWRNRVGFICYEEYKDSYEKLFGPYYEPETTWVGRWQRSRNGINFFCAFLGSLALGIGCVMFIPATDSLLEGIWIFIYGSFAIMLSQSWKVWRIACTNHSNLADRNFRFGNLIHDFPLLLSEIAGIIGAGMYLLGSTFFLPRYDSTNQITNEAASFFVAGSVLNLIGGLMLTDKYFINTTEEDGF